MSDWLLVLVGALAATYVVACLTWLDGPGDVFLRLRDRAETHGPPWLAKLLDCPWCTGFWAGLAVALLVVGLLGWPWLTWPLLAAAYGAAAGLLLETQEGGS